MNKEAQKPNRAQEKSFRLRAKQALLVRNMTIEALAAKLRNPSRTRSTVSKAINHDRFPRVRKQVAKALGL